MIVPKYWATGTMRQRNGRKQITVQRWGWSDASQAAAQAHAEERTAAAMTRIVGGVELQRREPKVAYNGAEGVPIREEIIATHGETVITRNGFGALCLNTPNVLFADIDLYPADSPPINNLSCLVAVIALIAGAWVGYDQRGILGGLVGAGLVLALFFYWQWLRHQRWQKKQETQARTMETALPGNLAEFIVDHPAWHLRLYRTPAGFRLLAMHQVFDPGDPAVAEFFDAIDCDPVFMQMCLRQRCFRARVSPKPWRVGIDRHYRPGVWPVTPDRQAERDRWVAQYDAAAPGYAACKFLEAFGSSHTAPEADAVCRLHDELCQAHSNKPLA